MVTLQKMGNGFNRNILEIVCKSTDVKPLNSTGGIDGQMIDNGSSLFQMDDSRVFLFDYDGDEWIEI